MVTTLTFTPDTAYHYNKINRGNDILIDLMGADHHGYINRLKASLETFGVDSDRLEIQIMQMVRLMQNGEEVKMSKRTGNAITLREIMDEVGIDAARYFLTMRSPDSHFDFDLELQARSNHKITQFIMLSMLTHVFVQYYKRKSKVLISQQMLISIQLLMKKQ